MKNIFKKIFKKKITYNTQPVYDIITTINHDEDYNKILIVDDDKINRYILNRYIKQINQDLIIDEVINGYDAIDMSAKNNYRFIFMDIKMPKIDGIETTKLILKNKPNAIIYGITGQIESSSVIKCINAGMKKCIAKPVDKKNIQDLFNL